MEQLTKGNIIKDLKDISDNAYNMCVGSTLDIDSVSRSLIAEYILSLTKDKEYKRCRNCNSIMYTHRCGNCSN